MSPEVLTNKNYWNIIDIWSLGVIFFELLTNSLPFTGNDGDVIKEKITTLDYNLELIPKNRNPELVILLKKMLVINPEQRWSAFQCLQYRIITEELHYLIKDNIIQLDKEAMEKIFYCKKLDKKITISLSDKEKKEIFDYFKHLELARKIDSYSIKNVYSPGYFKTKVYNTITGRDLESTINDLSLKDVDVEDLLNSEYLINITDPKSKTLDLSKTTYYKVMIEDIEKVDNSIKYPFDQHKDDPITLSINCLSKIEKVFNSVTELYSNSSEITDENTLKLKVSTSKLYMEFLVEIRKFRKIDILTCSKESKLAVILNLYMTMFRHLQIKSFLATNESTNGLVENVKSIFYKPKLQVEVRYDIGGSLITLYELMHIVIRRNKKPIENYYFDLASSSDVRIKFIDHSNPKVLENLLLLCIDPMYISEIDDYIIDFSPYDDKNIEEQIETRCKTFFKDNLTINLTQITIPKFLVNYQKEFGSGEDGDIIKFLMKFNVDPDVKPNFVLKNYKEKKLQISWV